MVYAFMIQTVLPGNCRVLYSNTYIPDPSTETNNVQEGDNTGIVPGESRAVRKERLQSIAEEIQSEYGFRVATSNRSFDTELQTLLNEGTLPDFEIGFFRLSPDTVHICTSKDEKIVVWLAALNSGFSLICDTNENRILAESVLKTLIKYLQDYCRILGEPNNALTRSDRVALIENQFLPNGKLLFMNHRVIRQFEKELETKMKSQT